MQRLGVSLTAATPDGSYLWDDVVSSYLNVQGHAVHQRSLIWIEVRPGSVAAATQLFWYVYAFTTDAGNNVPAAMIFSPQFGQAVLQKELMDFGMMELQGNVGTSVTGSVGLNTIVRNVQAKRKFSDTDAIMLVLEATTAITVDLVARTYCSF